MLLTRCLSMFPIQVTSKSYLGLTQIATRVSSHDPVSTLVDIAGVFAASVCFLLAMSICSGRIICTVLCLGLFMNFSFVMHPVLQDFGFILLFLFTTPM